MGNKDIRTNVVIAAETKGFDAARQKAAKVTSEAAKGMAAQVKGFGDAEKGSAALNKALERLNKTKFTDVGKQIGGLKDNLSELHKKQHVVTEAMAEMDDKAGPAYEKLKERLKQINQEAKSTTTRIKSLTGAFAKQAEVIETTKIKRKAFAQGMAQGGFPIPGIGLQRGPGMGSQMRGMALGMGLRGAVSGIGAAGSAAFGGVQGMARGISAIPLVGGALAGQFQQAAAYAQQNIAWQRTKLAQAPYMESTQDILRRQVSLSRNAAYQKAVQQRQASESDVSALVARASYLEERASTVERIKGGGVVGGDEILNLIQREEQTREPVSRYMKSIGKRNIRKLGRKDITRDDPGLLRLQARQLDDEMATALASQRKADDAVIRAEVKARSRMRDPLAGIGSMGVSLMGVSKPEAAQMAGAIAQAGGGYISGARQRGLIGEGFAARTAFGIGPETTGAFFGAARRGGLVGGGGRSGSAFKDAIAEGLEMGFSRSEVNKWMQMTAQGIQRFENTGIPINTKSISDLAGDISGAGLTGTRAAAMARGITGGLQGIGSRGIQSGTDLMMLQLVGGYRGGGAADYRAARSRLEELDIGGQGVGGLARNTKVSEALRRVMSMAGGDKASQAELLQQVVTRLGGQGSVKEFDWLASFLRGETGSPEQQLAIQKEGARRADGASAAESILEKGGLKALARTSISGYAPDVKKMASLENRQIAVGAKMVKTVMKLEDASMKTTEALNKNLGGAIDKAADGLIFLQKKAIAAAEAIAEGQLPGFTS